MDKMNKKNVIWIVIDCVRNYKSDYDDRGKLDIMYELEKEFISFNKMMVSAPSSVMSATTFLTSIPAYYLAGNYSQFQFDRNSYWSVKDILGHEGYTNFSIMNALPLRTLLKDMVDPIDKKYWTKDVRSTMMRWPNSEVTKIFYNLIDSNPIDPNFYFLWYNVRRDPNISSEIKNLINTIKSRGLFDDSIVIVTSDHGYPDKRRGFVSDGGDLMKAGIPHDIILTNDNINVPFLIHYPGSTPATVDSLVSTEDIMPTIMDILGIKVPYEKKLPLFGKSLIPLIHKKDSEFFKERIVRSDARFSLQKDRMTSLQQKEYHYIIRHEDNKEELYNTLKDPEEIDNIANIPEYKNKINFFRKYFKSENKKILKLQQAQTSEKLATNLETYKHDIDNCWLIVFGKSYLYETVLDVLYKHFPDIKISLIVAEDINFDKSSINPAIELISHRELTKKSKTEKRNFRIEVVDDPVANEFRNIYEKYRLLFGSKIIRINWNGDIEKINFSFLSSPRIIYYRDKYQKIMYRVKLGIKEPIYFIEEFGRLYKQFIKK
jgi:hypothetical protein